MVFPDPANGLLQCTLNQVAHYQGSGRHGNSRVSVKLAPASVDSGIRMVRTDVDSRQSSIPASWKNVVDTGPDIVLGNDFGTTVTGVGHLLAALRISGVDNLVIEVDSEEIPALDGSAAPLLGLITAAGIARQNRPRFGIWIERPVEVRQGERYALLTPSNLPRITLSIDHNDKDEAAQCLSLQLTRDVFVSQIAPAHDPGFVDKAQEPGMLNEKSENTEDARFGDEYLRYRLLECYADLTLAGAPVFGHLFTHKPGHDLNIALLDALFANGEGWRWLKFEEINRRIRHEEGAGKPRSMPETTPTRA